MRPFAFRYSLSLALLLMPDNRPDTRRAVMRGAVWMERGQLELSSPQRKRLLRGLPRTQQVWVAVGVWLFLINRKNVVLLPLGAASFVFLLYSFISSWVK